jgi:hypothetical protein
MSDPQEVYRVLDALGIRYQAYEHPAVFTAEDAAVHWTPIQATPVKNLFLRNKRWSGTTGSVSDHPSGSWRSSA